MSDRERYRRAGEQALNVDRLAALVSSDREYRHMLERGLDRLLFNAMYTRAKVHFDFAQRCGSTDSFREVTRAAEDALVRLGEAYVELGYFSDWMQT
jgi:hypothetical protein